VTDDDEDPPASYPEGDAAPDVAPPEALVGPPITPAERDRRSTLLEDAVLRDALLRTLSRCGKAHRDEILNEGIADALAADGFPDDVGMAVHDFVANKINNARSRYFYQRTRDGKHEELGALEHQARSGGATAKERLNDVLEAAERLAAESKSAAQGLAVLKAKNLEGLTVAEAARRENLSTDAAHKAMQRLKKALRAVMVVFAAVIVGSLAMRYRHAFQNPNLTGLGPDPTPAPPVPPPAPDPAKLAAPLVEEGLAACERKEWRFCLGKLEQAGALDSEVYRDGRVEDAIRRANEAIAKEDSKSNGKGDKAPADPAPRNPQEAP